VMTRNCADDCPNWTTNRKTSDATNNFAPNAHDFIL
jgi:hypothetical protein